jgi:hypothetical protein
MANNKRKNYSHLIGSKVHDWTILAEEDGREYYSRKKGGKVVFVRMLVRCKCGFETTIRLETLKRGKSKRCRHCSGREEGAKYLPSGLMGSDNSNWRGTGKIPARMMASMIGGAKARRLVVEVTIDDLSDIFNRQQGKCAVTGISLIMRPSIVRDVPLELRWRFASIDRIDGSKGYIKGNVQWVSKAVNIMKNVMPEDLFFMWCRTIAHRHPGPVVGDSIINQYQEGK